MEWFITGILLGLIAKDISGFITSRFLLRMTSRKRKQVVKNTIKRLEEHANEENQV